MYNLVVRYCIHALSSNARLLPRELAVRRTWPTACPTAERMAGQTDIRSLVLQGPPFTSLYIQLDGLRHICVRNIGDKEGKRTPRARNIYLKFFERSNPHNISKSLSDENKYQKKTEEERENRGERSHVSYLLCNNEWLWF